jgi:hypothetical protein
VNCHLTGSANNDFHIPIAAHPGDSELDAIVVEMIPQSRHPGWTVRKLRTIAREHTQVRVTGQLMYDNAHLVNDDPDNILPRQPKRFSLWEIHPVTKFEVCELENVKGFCDDWMPLEGRSG